ncbi:MAG: dienelactone hydrolase family protein [Verrucomicrobia bacterium]|nr:dienelactone hydrolase family protein [Verrucomicrobiota bacterium]
MTLREHEFSEVTTATGPMRVHVVRPAAEGTFPGLVLFSEIFQVTAPIRRTAAFYASHGYVVAVPEIYHESENPGSVLAYDTAGADRGNALKFGKSPKAIDSDARATLDFLLAHPACNGRLGVIGICIGGHLSFRAAATNADARAGVCFYATDLQGGTKAQTGDDTLNRAGDIQAEMLFFWGRQDPHVPLEGRRKIQAALEAAGVNFTWHEFNAQHAFLRDEGLRYDPALAWHCQGLVLEMLTRRLK